MGDTLGITCELSAAGLGTGAFSGSAPRKLMASSDEHPLNGSDCFLTIFEYNLRDMETLRNEVQFSNANCPMDRTESGMSIDSNAEHSINAQ